MKISSKSFTDFLGLITNLDETQIALGGATKVQNIAQLVPGRIRRIPGVTSLGSVAVNGSTQIPLVFYGKELAGVGQPNRTVAVYIGGGSTTLVNLSTGVAMTGPALTSTVNTNWSYAFYAQQHLVVGKGNAIQKITADGTYAALGVTGSLTAAPEMIQSFQDRLYVVDNTNAEGFVQYSDALTNNFQAANVVNTKEVPGPITALGIYVPSTGTMGIRSALLIFKQNGIWVWDEASKDLISQKIGSLSPHAIANSPAGVLLLGKKGSINSIYLIPPGMAGYGLYHFGEPIDVGKSLFNLLNGSSGITPGQEINAYGVVDGRFYKLFIAVNGATTNSTELWLDLDILTQNPGETREGKEPMAIWYGPHTRGSVDAAVATDTRLEIVRRAASGVNSWFAENTDATQNFVDMDSAVLTAILDLPINVDPQNFEKIFDIAALHLASESNVLSNAFTFEPFADGASQGSQSMGIYNANIINAAVHILFPLHSATSTGAAGHHARVILTHTLDKRLDLIGFTVQYYAMEDEGRIVPDAVSNGPFGVSK